MPASFREAAAAGTAPLHLRTFLLEQAQLLGLRGQCRLHLAQCLAQQRFGFFQPIQHGMCIGSKQAAESGHDAHGSLLWSV